jgi:CRISPR-associated protein Cas2
MQARPVDWMVCYDIANPKRLARIFKLLKSHGVPIQYSVFLVRASVLEMQRIVAKIQTIICDTEDDVRAYQIPAKNCRVLLGQALLPDVLIGCGAL